MAGKCWKVIIGFERHVALKSIVCICIYIYIFTYIYIHTMFFFWPSIFVRRVITHGYVPVFVFLEPLRLLAT